jgi:hypothetical protein
MTYEPSNELLSNNGRNLIREVMKAYTKLFKTKHRVTIPYHLRTNGKVENLNETIRSMLTKMLTNQPTIL